MKKFTLFTFLIIIYLGSSAKDVKAAAPSGYLDVADGYAIAGWAKDDDYDGPISVHVYVDGVLVHDQLANRYRPDVGEHAYHWNNPPFGAGDHQVIVYAIGVDSNGVPDGENIGLTNSPRAFNIGCDRLQGDQEGWCRNNPSYWINRQADTKLLWNKYIKIGINNSYGGTIIQLFSQDRTYNLILEHGGGAIQLSIWGADGNSSEAKFYGNDGDIGRCDPKTYDTQGECLQNNEKCVFRKTGEHVATCNPPPCNQWDVAVPWNPIMAQGAYCAWSDSTNDVSTSTSCGTNCWKTVLDNPGHFTKNVAGMSGMKFTQKVTLGDVYAKIDYTADYTGPHYIGLHPQEIPAIFTNGLSDKYYFYQEDQPYTNDPRVTVQTNVPQNVERYVRFPGREPYGHWDNYEAIATESWWGVCNNAETHCLTVASFSNTVKEAALKKLDWGGYITALGYFDMPSGSQRKSTVYVFPYKYDEVIDGKSIRDRIYELAGPIATPTPTPKPGDANGDGRVDGLDYIIWLTNYNKTTPNGSSDGDFNADGKVDGLDYVIWLNNYEG